MDYFKSTFKPFPNQIKNASFLMKHRKALLFDKVGSGKTVSVLLGYAKLKKAGLIKNMLVLTPLSAYSKDVWKLDIQKFTTFKCIKLDDLVKRYTEAPTSLEKILNYYDIIYGKHSAVKQVSDILERICNFPRTLLVIDEVHAFKNPRSSLTLQSKLTYRNVYGLWGLTGTSLSKNLEDTYNIINFIRPWFFGTFQQFKDKYCEVEKKVIGRLKGGRGLRRVDVITGIRDENSYQEKLSHIAVQGESFIKPHFHYLDYVMSPAEKKLYRLISKGIELGSPDDSNESWISQLLSMKEEELPSRPIKEVQRYSSRFIYLQSASDGVLTETGEQNRLWGTKLTLCFNKLKELVDNGRSVLVYFDFYAALDCFKRMIQESNLNCTLLESTGSHVLKPGDVTPGKCKIKPHVILCTKASAESVSYWWIQDEIIVQIPTTPSTFVQFVGRVTRRNSIAPDDINIYICRSENIDYYKLCVVGSKAAQMEITSGYEANIPDDIKISQSKEQLLDHLKKSLLWNLK